MKFDLTDRERGALIVIAGLILVFNIVRFPAIARGESDPLTGVVQASPEPPKVAYPTPAPAATIAAPEELDIFPNPYVADVHAEPSPRPSGFRTMGQTDTDPGARGQMGDLAQPGGRSQLDNQLVLIGAGDTTALIAEGGRRRLVQVGDAVGARKIASISPSIGLVFDDGTSLAPSRADAAPNPDDSPSPSPSSEPSPDALASPTPPHPPGVPTRPPPPNMSPALYQYLQSRGLPVPTPTGE